MSGKYQEICEGILRRERTVFFVVDSSGGMTGAKVAYVNKALLDATEQIAQISSDSADAAIKIAVLKYSYGAEWLYPKPIEAEVFQWIDIDGDGLANFGAACEELKAKLTRKHGFMSSGGSYAPIIVWLSYREPTDNYSDALRCLCNNAWFRHASKVAINFGDDVSDDLLNEFAGNSDYVIHLSREMFFYNNDVLSKAITTLVEAICRYQDNGHDTDNLEDSKMACLKQVLDNLRSEIIARSRGGENG